MTFLFFFYLPGIGIAEIKDSFWQHFESGKRSAKRRSMWDMMFMGLGRMARGRDESWLEYALKLLMQVLVNFSVSLCLSLVFFTMGLWSIVRSYQPNPIMAVLCFVGAACAAFFFVATYIMGMFGAAGAGVYSLVKIAETSSRAQIGGGGGQRQRFRQHAHYD